MKKLLFLAAAVIGVFSSAAGFDSGYNTTKSLYDQGYYGELPGGNTQQPAQDQNITSGPGEQPLTPRNNILNKKPVYDAVITPRNIYEPVLMVPKSLEIVYVKDTALYGAVDLEDLFDDMTGMFVNRTGIGESPAFLSVRGAGSSHTLIMQDSIPLNDIYTGLFDLNKVDMSNAGKLEIIRTGMSTIYGSNADAGVINIITGQKERKMASLAGIYGTCGLQKYGVASNYRVFNVDYSASFMDEKWMEYFLNSDSFKRSISAKASFTNGLLDSNITGSYLKRESGVPFDSFGGTTPGALRVEEDYSLGINEVVNLDFMKVKVSGYMRSNDLREKDAGAFVPIDLKNISKEYQASLLGMYLEGEFISVVAGYEVGSKSFDRNSAGPVDVINNAAMTTASARLFSDSLLVSAGTRVDINTKFGAYPSENVSAKYKFKDGLELFASFDKSFSFPSFMQLYEPDNMVIYFDAADGSTKTSITTCNPDLKPDEYTSYEAGISKKHDTMKETVVWFLRDSTNMIDMENTVVDGGPSGITVTSRPVNLPKARTMGIEVKVDWTPLEFWSISAQYNLLFTEDSKTNTGAAYVDGGNANSKTYRLYTSLKLPYKVNVGFTADYVDYLHDFRGDRIQPYFMLNIRATQQLSQNMELFLHVDNMLDNKDYRVTAKMPMPGRIVIAGAKLEF